MKKLLKKLSWLIYHKTDLYITNKIQFDILHYNEYRLYRIDKVFLINYRILIDTCSSLGCGNKKRNNWFYTYKNIIEID